MQYSSKMKRILSVVFCLVMLLWMIDVVPNGLAEMGQELQDTGILSAAQYAPTIMPLPELIPEPTPEPTAVPTPVLTAVPTAEPTQELTVERALRLKDEPMPDSMEVTTAESTAEPTTESTTEPTTVPTTDTTVETTVALSVEPTTELTQKPMPERTTELKYELTADPTRKLTPVAALEPDFVLTSVSAQDIIRESVAEPLSVIITLDKMSVALDKGETITATCEVTGGVPPYRFDYNRYGVLDGEDIIFDDQGYVSEASLTYRPSFGTAGFVEVTVKDLNGDWVRATSQRYVITDDPEVQPLKLSAFFDKQTVDISKGESITVTCTATGGEAPYTYSFWWLIYSGVGNSWSYDHIDEGNKSTLTPIYGEAGEVYIEVFDAKGREAYIFTSDYSITGDPNPISLTITLDKDSVDMGKDESITANWSITGGAPPYTTEFSWWIDGDGADTEIIPVSLIGGVVSATFKPIRGQYGRAVIDVEDSMGRSTSKVEHFDITDSTNSSGLRLTILLDKVTVDLTKGESITATLTTMGGAGPYLFNTEWFVEENGEELYYDGNWETTSGTASIKPLFGDSGRLWAEVVDDNGIRQTAEAWFDIIGAPNVEPLKLSILLDKRSVTAGQSIGATWTPTGGQAPYLFSYDWIVSDAEEEYGIISEWEIADASSIFVPRFGQKGRLQVSVTDAVGRSEYNEANFFITGAPVAEPLTLTIQLDKTSVTTGQSIGATWQASGGRGEYHFNILWRLTAIDIITGEERTEVVARKYQTTETSSSMIPIYGIGGSLFVYVWDEDGRTSADEGDFTIVNGETAVSIPNVNLTLNPQTGREGSSITVSVQVSGGTAPYQYSYEWDAYTKDSMDPNIFSKAEAFGDAAQQTVTLPTGNWGVVTVAVRDAKGRIANEIEAFAITPAGSDAAKPGDANDDSVVDIMDLVAIIDFIVYSTPIASAVNADANGDGGIDIMDLVWIIDYIVHS